MSIYIQTSDKIKVGIGLEEGEEVTFWWNHQVIALES